MTLERVLPYWYDEIAPAILSGQKVVVAAHGNSIRAILKHLDNISEKDIVELNIPTGLPLVYELDEQLKPIKHYYLATEEEIARKIATVKAQGEAKKA
jgi:2,3-bisphosphoglycerate-dependent phosphoglycerate mutase